MRISDWSSDVCSSDLMWSFDGEKFSEGVEPIRFERNERARVVLINNTMMTHPVHLHGHFLEVVNGHTGSYPRQHKIGRASCRARVCQSLYISVVVVPIKKNIIIPPTMNHPRHI